MTRDALTGLFDRRAFRDLARAGQAAVVFDIVGLIHVNDVVGYQGGDAALRGVAAVLTEHVAARGGDAFRVGGDELVWVAPPDGDPWAGAREVCARVQALRGPARELPRPLRLSVVRVKLTSADLADPWGLCDRAAERVHAARLRAGVRGAVMADDAEG